MNARSRQRAGRGIVGVLLAAGRSIRFGGDKRLAAMAGGEPMAVVSCRNLQRALDEVVAVVRPGDAELGARLAVAGARVIACPDADRGMGRTLAHGVSAAADARGWVIALADMPWIAPETIAAVARSLEAGASIVAPSYRGQRGHPVAFGAGYRAALLALDGDRGARELVQDAKSSLELVEVDDPGVLRDVDAPADLDSESRPS